MSNRLAQVLGLSLFRLPATANDRENQRRRGVVDLGATSAAHLLGAAHITPDGSLLFCGGQGRALPILRQLVRMTDRPFVLVGTARELGKTACLYRLSPVWTLEAPQSRLPAGSGALRLSSTGAETCLELKAALPGWGDRLPILLLGQGLQLDAELLNLLNGLGSYILLTEALGRSTKRGNGSGLTVQELLSAMDCLLIASAGSGARDLLAVLPEYQREKITNLMDFSLHRDGAHAFAGRGGRPHRGSGLVFGQSRSLERSSLFEPDELTDYQDRGILIAYQVRRQHTWIAKVCQ